MNESINPRHHILEDKEFWDSLEFGMSLQPEKTEKIPRFWIDGFIPESVRDTAKGIEVQGKVWIMEGQKPTSCRFEALIPQKLLRKKIKEFDYAAIEFDPERQYLRFEIKS